MCSLGLLELVIALALKIRSYQLLQVLLFASKDVETRNNQSFPLKLRVPVKYMKEVPRTSMSHAAENDMDLDDPFSDDDM